MILTVGCSFTYGEELDDPSTEAWSSLLAKKLNDSVENLGRSGASNDRIYRTAMHRTAVQTYDLVIVQWTEISRMEVWNEHRESVDVTARMNSLPMVPRDCDWVLSYYAQSYDDSFRQRQFVTQMLGLQSWFKQRQQKYLFVSLDDFSVWRNRPLDDTVQMLEHLDVAHFIGWPDRGLKQIAGTHRLPGRHPSKTGHQIITYTIYDHIRNFGWVS